MLPSESLWSAKRGHEAPCVLFSENPKAVLNQLCILYSYLWYTKLGCFPHALTLANTSEKSLWLYQRAQGNTTAKVTYCVPRYVESPCVCL